MDTDTANSLKTLNLKRGQIKARLTRFHQFLETININKDKLIEIKLRKEKAERVWDEYETVQCEIEILDPETNSAEERLSFETKYFEVIAAAEAILSKINHSDNQSTTSENQNIESVVTEPEVQVDASTEAPTEIAPTGVYTQKNTPSLTREIEHVNNNTQFNIKLPDISLPEFKGSYDKWVAFHDTFMSLIHNNIQLSAIQKFYYLQAALKDEAAAVINNLEISENNYSVAWSLLKDRYENKKVIIHSHLRAIFELQTVHKESHGALRSFLDTFLLHFRALKNLNQTVNEWNTILLYLLVSKLDISTKKEWELSTKQTVEPTVTEFITFLNNKCHLLETLDNKVTHNYSTTKKSNDHRQFTHVSTTRRNCLFCNGTHFIYSCRKFLNLDANARFEQIKRLKLCTNCLRPGHTIQVCTGSSCKTCKKKHNTLLHFDQNSASSASNTSATNTDANTNAQASNTSTIVTNCSQLKHEYVLLSTAIIYIFDYKGNPVKCRALLDSASQSNFITKNLFKKLKLSSTLIDIPVLGLNKSLTHISQKAQGTIVSAYNNHEYQLDFLIIDKITENIPQVQFDIKNLQIPAGINLADPQFNVPGPIDILIGAGVFFDLLQVGQIKINKSYPILQKSSLGWLISGSIPHQSQHSVCNLAISNQSLYKQLEKFWTIEDVSDSSRIKYTQEELDCETHFKNTFSRDKNGRFTVSLPFRKDSKVLGNSEQQAINRFNHMERKLQKDSKLQKYYVDFMTEYEKLDHMQQITVDDHKTDINYYLPHHSISKDSLTTKVRVVFDASAKTSSDVSLNDILMVGPCIQDDLFAIMLRFRMHNIVLIADISKMYRQINVRKEDRKFQRIVWRANPREHLKHYELNTVTYGTAPASFLATRCLQQLADENKVTQPVASKVIREDFYMDDLISGSTDINNAIALKRDLEKILSSAGFVLRKWISNEPQVLNDAGNISHEEHYVISPNENTKTLGIYWDSIEDVFQFKIVTNISSNTHVTKRTILSTIARIFDPIGFLGPVIVRAKLILQKLWQCQQDWDATLPPNLFAEWLAFCKHLPALNNLKVPRQMTLIHAIDIQIHGYCDASEAAYAACLYLRMEDSAGNVKTSLICSKSRVAPLKTITLPRLELCGAVLLARLSQKVKNALGATTFKFHYWCDSTIVLCWISTAPSSCKTFVANRISEIQQVTDVSCWNHVPSGQNPADIISRGCSAEQLKGLDMWWKGPPFLAKSTDFWPSQGNIEYNHVPELKQPAKVTLTEACSQAWNIFERYSNYMKLVRIMGYICRFVNKSRKRDIEHSGLLSVEEINEASLKLAKLAQLEFATDLQSLKRHNRVPKTSRLLALNPFVDKNDIIRVGGRLSHSSLTYNQKFPIIIPPNHKLTSLIIRHEHHKNLHAGMQFILSNIRNQFWPLNAKQTIKRELMKCVTCFKVKPTNQYHQMGDLPRVRVTPNRVFASVGVDFAGPYSIKDGKLKNRKLIKVYFCLFICLATKAVHIEPVGDLSSDSFLNTLKRFVSRRGLCERILSDNATNFIGANNELCKLSRIISNETFQAFLTENKVRWDFIPARSPHFGGIWEAAIKSTKYHLKRVAQNINFTYEEFLTLLTQVECILNSRPLTPLSSDPNDLEALTPGHFIIGASMKALPQENVCNLPSNRLTRYRHLQQITQHFWNRWSKDYLNTLLPRTKWKSKASATQQVPKGALVLLKEDHLPPQQWRLGRVTELYPGPDGVLRVVGVKTRSGIVKRAVRQVCVLPIEIDEPKC